MTPSKETPESDPASLVARAWSPIKHKPNIAENTIPDLQRLIGSRCNFFALAW